MEETPRKPVKLFFDIGGTLGAQSDPAETLRAIQKALEEKGYAPEFYILSLGTREDTEMFVKNRLQNIPIAGVFSYKNTISEFQKAMNDIGKLNGKEDPFLVVDNDLIGGQSRAEGILMALNRLDEIENSSAFFVHYDDKKKIPLENKIYIAEMEEKLDEQREIKGSSEEGLGVGKFPPCGPIAVPTSEEKAERIGSIRRIPAQVRTYVRNFFARHFRRI